MPTPIEAPGALPTPNGSTATLTQTFGGKAKPTPAPPVQKSNRVGISGVWEVQIQRSSGTTYTHFKIDQNGDLLTGQYLDKNGKRYPIEGSLDGKVVHLVVSLPNGKSMTFSGTQDGGTDMLGMVKMATDAVGFTASYRPKYKWIDNLNATPGGMQPQAGAP